MVSDYGAGSHRQLKVAYVGVAVGGTLAILGFSGWLVGGAYLKHRSEALAIGRAWAIDGPPCPELTKAQFGSRGLKAPKGTNFSEVIFFRRFGHMQCTELRYGQAWSPAVYPACQFTSPAALGVRTRKGEWWFAPPVGQPATIFVPHGLPRCVLAAKFTLRAIVER